MREGVSSVEGEGGCVSFRPPPGRNALCERVLVRVRVEGEQGVEVEVGIGRRNGSSPDHNEREAVGLSDSLSPG